MGGNGTLGAEKMNKVICVKGHFYDGDKYEECPHCAAGVEAVKQDPFSIRHSEMEEEKPKLDKHGFFHREGKKVKEEKTPVGNVYDKTVLLQEEENKTGGKSGQSGEQKQYGQQESPQADERERKRYYRTENQSVSRAEEKRERETEKSRPLSTDLAASAQKSEESGEGKSQRIEVGIFAAVIAMVIAITVVVIAIIVVVMATVEGNASSYDSHKELTQRYLDDLQYEQAMAEY